MRHSCFHRSGETVFFPPRSPSEEPFVPEGTNITASTTCLMEDGEKQKDDCEGDPEDVNVNVACKWQLVDFGICFHNFKGGHRF